VNQLSKEVVKMSALELHCIEVGESQGIQPFARWEAELDLGASPDEIWNRITKVTKLVVSYTETDWPEDATWQTLLPEWLRSFMMTADECDHITAQTPREHWGDLPWEFGSWLDAMRDRDWMWWGSHRLDNHVRLVLKITGIPPRIDAFKQIILASGATIISEFFV
jgi:hypothetical protein